MQRPLELAVALLDVAVLVGLRRIDGLALQAVVAQQHLVALLKRLPVTPRRHGRGQGVGAMQVRHAAQFDQGVLQAVAEALEALSEADGAGLPVRVGQHEVVDQVGERQALDGDLQARRVGEVRGAEPAGGVDLGEEDLLGRPVQGTPRLDVPLQSTQLAVGEAAGVLALQPGEQGVGLEARVEGQLFLDALPDVGERVGARPPGMRHAYLAGQLTEPAILACSLVVDAGLGGGLGLGQSLVVEAAQTANVQVGDHPKPPCRQGFG